MAAFSKQRRTYDTYDFMPQKRQRDSQSNQEEAKHTITMASGEKKKIAAKVISKDVTMREKSQDR